MLGTRPSARRGRAGLIAGSVVVAAATLAGCGSSSSSSSSAQSAAETTSAGGGSASAGLAQAQAELKKLVPPRSIAPTTRSTKPLPTGSKYKIVIINTGQPNEIAQAVKDAVSGMHLGWQVVVEPTQATPQTVQAAWTSAVRMHPSAIYGIDFPRTEFAPELAQAKADGIPVIQSYTLDPVGNGITFAFGGRQSLDTIGRGQAAWVTNATKGKANVLNLTLPAFQADDVITSSLTHWMGTYCPGCKVSTQNVATSRISDTPSMIVSYLRAHPEINAITYAYDQLAVGVPAALKAAGLSDKVVTIGESPSTENLAYIKAGEQGASMVVGNWEAWASAVDATARILTHQQPVAGDGETPWWPFAQDTPQSDNGISGPVVPNLYQKYLALWPKG